MVASDAERPLRRIMHDSQLAAGPAGVMFTKRGSTMSKAPEDGVYELGSGRFKVKKGMDIPNGGVFKPAYAPAARTHDPEGNGGKAPSGSSARFGELDGERIAQALTAAGYYMVKVSDLSDPIDGEEMDDMALTEEQLAEKAKAKAAATTTEDEKKDVTGPSENTQGTGPSETPEAPGGPLVQKSATVKKTHS
jgi:hypothetical protein